MRLTTIALFAIALLLLAAVAVAPATRVDLARSSVPVAVASTSAPLDVPLSEILNGRYQPGFFPSLDGAVNGAARPDRVVWLRLQAKLDNASAKDGWFVRLERAPIDRVAVLLPDRPSVEVAESRYFRLGSWDARWPDGFVMPLPDTVRGDVAVYLRVEGSVDADLRPQLISGVVLAEREAASLRLFGMVYGVLLLSLTLCVVRPIRNAGAGGWGMAGLTLVSILTTALVNDHLPLPLRAVLDPWLGGGLVYASTLLLAGCLLVVARKQSGLKSNSNTLALWYLRVGLGLIVLAGLATRVPADYADLLRRVAELVWSQAWVLVLVAFGLDRRRLRWLPIALMTLLLGALIVRGLAANGTVPPSALALYGYQLMIAVLMLSLVLLPWLRSLPVNAPTPAPEAPVVSVEERWSMAEARMVSAIESALRYGGSAEADWVVARRLIDTLKPILEAQSVAVARSTMHGEDHILVEPPEAESAYAMLLRERARVLRSLLRLGAPQQLVVPMGIEGLSHVALVPYLLSESGWTAVLVERRGDAFEPAELTRIEGLVAAARRSAGQALDARAAALRADLDMHLEVLNAEALQRDFRASFERCRDASESITLLRIPLAGEGGFELRARAVISALESLDALPSRLLGRPTPDELWLVLPGFDVHSARALGDQLHERLAPQSGSQSGLTPAGTRPMMAEWVIGIGALSVGERVPRPMIDRAGEAISRARVPGAQPVQAAVPVAH
jgi:hypothetical protein